MLLVIPVRCLSRDFFYRYIVYQIKLLATFQSQQWKNFIAETEENTCIYYKLDFELFLKYCLKHKWKCSLPFQDVVEVFSLNTIGHVHHFSDDPDLNSVLVFNTIQTEEKFAAMHLFQSDRVPVCTHASKLPILVIEFLKFP